jgi:hypothetical protein
MHDNPNELNSDGVLGTVDVELGPSFRNMSATKTAMRYELTTDRRASRVPTSNGLTAASVT